MVVVWQPVLRFMRPTTVAKFFAGRMHYAWVVLVVMFFAMLAGVGVRAAPGVMILPLERAFGWSVVNFITTDRLSLPIAGSGVIFLSSAIVLMASGAVGELVYRTGDVREQEFSGLTERIASVVSHHPVSFNS